MYLNYYNIRQVEAQYLGMFYEALGHNLDAHYILNEDYLKNYEGKRWEVKWAENHFGKYGELLSRIREDSCTVARKAEDMLKDKKNLSYYLPDSDVPSKILDISVNCDIREQRELIEDVLKNKDIKAGITWVNNKCLEDTLAAHNIPTIHHELGPFRPPVYIPTAYFDFSGVNGNTEFDKRFEQFLQIADEVPILSRKELIRVLSPKNYKSLWEIAESSDYEYEAGVGLQVEVDTNLLLFNNGCSWIDPILLAKTETEGKVLVRPHPMASYIFKDTDNRITLNDTTKYKAHDFISKCKKVYCLNSSVGTEAILLNREARILGENPFTTVSSLNSDLQLKALNFLVFGYLIHRDLLFDNEYYEFRLKNIGNEKLIYKDNVRRLLNGCLKKG